MIDTIAYFLQKLFDLLPNSPVQTWVSGSGISEFRNLLGYINWFIPFGACADILTAWAGFMAVIYNWENIKGIFDRKV